MIFQLKNMLFSLEKTDTFMKMIPKLNLTLFHQKEKDGWTLLSTKDKNYDFYFL